ncbi:hypothetical protein J2X36_003588 [Methylobacterium sp. BE186]|uniref:hypothetical protein n=1 Tax=Methylobacterium sp. BE186 TaxID=2817715 RepID=UPI00286543AB|nr:hypothetical protein [Methylobacterium sp. BE186]MDR7038817.1 hypothetical protein [Methylobacterium sp. BE186]
MIVRDSKADGLGHVYGLVVVRSQDGKPEEDRAHDALRLFPGPKELVDGHADLMNEG